MPFRREPRNAGGYVLSKGRFKARIQLGLNSTFPVTIAYYKYLGEKPSFRITPIDHMLVQYSGRTSAPNLAEGKLVARAVLEELDSRTLEPDLVPIEPQVKPIVIKDIEHPDKMLQARIVQWPDRYEIFLLAYVPNGYLIPVSTPSFSTDLNYEWGRFFFDEQLIADTLEEAEQAALAEMDELSSTDSNIQSRSK